MNRITIIGNLVANPESRMVNTESGAVTVCNFTVAANRLIRGKRTAEFFRVTCWRGQAENAMKYLLKGRKVAVVGSVTARAYTANDGSARASLEVQAEEIEYLSSRQDEAAHAGTSAATGNEGFTEVDDDELPF